MVADVHAFPGHIVCDSASRSELVVPIIKEVRVLGVLDLDSLHLNRFDDQDLGGLRKPVQILLAATDMTL